LHLAIKRREDVTHTVNTPLPAPATKVAEVPPIVSGQATLNLSLIALNVANLTAELVACLHNTGVHPLHKLNTPSLFTTCEIILGKDCLPKLPPEDASWITRVLRDSPGVTTNTLSVTPAHRPETTFMAVVLVLLDTRVKYLFEVSKEKKRTPDLMALEVARVWQPAYTLLMPWFAMVERRIESEEGVFSPWREISSWRRVLTNSAGYCKRWLAWNCVKRRKNLR
jgi:hypothetical protein